MFSFIHKELSGKLDAVFNDINSCVFGLLGVDKIAYCHMAGRILFIQHPEKADIRFTQLLNKPDGNH